MGIGRRKVENNLELPPPKKMKGHYADTSHRIVLGLFWCSSNLDLVVREERIKTVEKKKHAKIQCSQRWFLLLKGRV